MLSEKVRQFIGSLAPLYIRARLLYNFDLNFTNNF